MTTQTSLTEFGVTPNVPGQDRAALWSAMFIGVPGGGTNTLRFREEPEDRAIQELMLRLRADSVHITPPLVVTDGVEVEPVGATCARVQEGG